ncbi:MAG: V-type ATP synthase subunit C [Bacillota bacterium]
MFDNKYLYAGTRTRVLETRLLDRSKIERMIDAKNAEEVIKVLSETEYATSISEMNDVYDYESILLKEILKTYAYISEVSPEPELTDIFLLKYDVHNLKVLLKSMILGEDNDSLLMNIGVIPVSKLKEAVKDRDFRDFYPKLAEGITEIMNNLETTPDPQYIDLVLDKSLYRAIYDIAVKSKSAFLKDYLSNQIDLINIRSFVRIKAIGYGRDYLSKVIIENGYIGADFYDKNFEEPVDTIADKLLSTKYHRVVEEGMESYAATKTLTKYEKLADDFIFDIAKKGKYIAFGIEPLVGYLMAKENEVKIIRIIMVGKNNQIPNELIRERLRDVYV